MVGDLVYLRLQPYRQTTMKKNHCHKLSPRYFGPYRILECIGKVAYKLDLPPTARIHPTFHVSLLKKKVGAHVSSSTQLPPLQPDGQVIWQPEQILSRGLFKRNNKPITRWLIKWLGLPVEDATWEDADAFLRKFPDFDTQA